MLAAVRVLSPRDQASAQPLPPQLAHHRLSARLEGVFNRQQSSQRIALRQTYQGCSLP